MSLSLSRKTIPYTPVTRPLSETTLMVVSTAGAHLTTQEPFNTAGDASYRVIPGDAHSSDFTVTHGAPKEHYNTDEPKRDINTIFPIDRLRELVETGFLGGLAEKHLTMMGYAMRLNQINQETVPAIANEVEKSRADAVLLTAGWPLCHRTVVTVQRGIEMIGIPTVLVTLDPQQSSLMRPSRAIHPVGFEFGHSLGRPHDVQTQTAVLKAALEHLVTKGEPGVIADVEFSSYREQ